MSFQFNGNIRQLNTAFPSGRDGPNVGMRTGSAQQLQARIEGGRLSYQVQSVHSIARSYKTNWFMWMLSSPLEQGLGQAEYMDAIDSLGVGATLDQRVTRDAIDWMAQAPRQTRLTISLTSRAYLSSSFLDALDSWLDRSQVRYEQLCLSLASHNVMRSLNQASGFLRELHRRGCFTMLDCGLPGNPVIGLLGDQALVDFVKLERQWIHGAGPSGQATLASVIGSAREQDIPVIAEDVDSVVQKHVLQRIGVDFYFGLAGAPARHVATRENPTGRLEIVA